MNKVVSGLLVFAIILSGCSLFKKDPQKAVDKGVSRLAEVKKSQSTFVLTGRVQAPPGEKPARVQLTVNATGASDTSDEDAPKLESAIKMDVITDDQKVSGELKIKMLDKKIYATLGSLNLPGEAGKSVNESLASVLNTWWLFPAEEKNPLTQLTVQQKEILEVLKTAKFFKNAQEDGEEEIQGETSTRYRVEVDRDGVKKFLLDVIRISGTQLKPEDEIAIGERLKEMEFSGAVWVGDDDIVHRIRGTITMAPTQGPTSSFDIDYTAWNYGEDVSVTAPEGAKDFDPLTVFSLMSAFGALAEAGTSTTGIVDDAPLGSSQVK